MNNGNKAAFLDDAGEALVLVNRRSLKLKPLSMTHEQWLKPNDDMI